MNRRELLERLAAIPLIGTLVPARASDGVALTPCAHPAQPSSAMEGDFDVSNLHYSREELPDRTAVLLDVPEHEFNHLETCIHCGAFALAVEDGLAERACWTRLAEQRKRALIASMDQTWGEALRKMPRPCP